MGAPAPVPPELLGRADARALLRELREEWLLALVLWALILATPLWLFPLWAMLLAARYHAMSLILHDACHNAPAELDLSWTLVEVLGGYPVGTSIDAMRYHHFEHHHRVNMEGDPYFCPVAGRPLRAALLVVAFGLLPLFGLLRAPFGVATCYRPRLRSLYGWFLLRPSSTRRASRRVAACARRDHGMFLFLLLLLGVTALAPRLAVLCYWIPIVLTGWTIGARFVFEHRYVRVSDRAPETVMSHTRDHHLRGGLSWLLAPRSGGYHLVHHLHPQVASRNLPRLRRWYLENHPTYPRLGGQDLAPVGRR